MEFNISPDVYKEKQLAIDDKFEKQKKNKLNKDINKKKSEYKNKADKLVVWDKSFKAYVLACCNLAKKIIFVIAIILAIGGAVAGGALGLDKEMNPVLYYVLAVVLGAICGVIAGFIAGFIGGYIYGAIFSVILCPIGYPIYILICNAKKKSVNKKDDQMYQQATAEADEMRKIAKEEIDKHYQETLERIEDYKEKFLFAANEKSKEYQNSTLVGEITDWLLEEFLYYIKSTDRSEKIETVDIYFTYCVENDCVMCTIFDEKEGKWDRENQKVYDFEERRYALIPDVLSQYAIALAIEKKLFSAFSVKYPLDESGTEWSVKFDYKDYWINDDDESVGIAVQTNINYIAPNGKFKPLQNW